MSARLGQNWQEQLLALEANWDSYGAPMIASAAIATVERFATVPTSEGGIQLEIHKDGYDIEILIGHDGRIESVLVGAEK